MRPLYLLLGTFALSAFIVTLNWWLALGALGFFGAAWFDAWVESIQARVVRELAKTCMCPLCVANREKPDGDGN